MGLDFIALATIFALASVIEPDFIARDFISQGKDILVRLIFSRFNGVHIWLCRF